MRSKCRESEKCYNSGCRSEACRLAATEARRERRRLAREAVGELPGLDAGRTRVVSMPINNALTSGTADVPLGNVEAAVLTELQALDAGMRPGLAAACVAMARILDNPTAVSSQPPAAKVLTTLLEKLRASAPGRRGNLRMVREMTCGIPLDRE